jgi:hypothetical protein
MKGEYAEAGSGSAIVYVYSARDVYIVAANQNGTPARITVMLDGKPVGANAGEDVDPKTGEAVISGDRLYTLVHTAVPGPHAIEIDVESGKLDAYTLTFG